MNTEGLVLIGVIAVLAIVILVPSLRKGAQAFTATLWFKIFGQQANLTVDRSIPSTTTVLVKGSKKTTIIDTHAASTVDVQESADTNITGTGKNPN